MRGIMKCLGLVAVILLTGVLTDFARAQGDAMKMDAPKKGFRAEALMDLAQLEKKFEDLASAVPAEKYSWRPGDGVRSAGEVFAHITGANYMFMGFLGAKPAMKMDPGMEKTATSKDDVVKNLAPSFEFVRTTISGLSDNDLEKTTKMFGYTVSYRMVIMTELGHLHEHLGQSIAYARTNQVVPPWTAAAEAASAKKDAK